LWQFYQLLNKLHPKKKIQEAVTLVSKRPSVPPHLDRSIVENLPEKPGVYIFYGSEGIPLYIGKSINIKDRVYSHFANVTESTREQDIAHQMKSIEYRETPGELGALLLEAKLIKELQPVYNRHLRKSEEVVYILKDSTKKGYLKPVIKTVSVHNDTEIDTILAVHKSKSQAKKQLEYLQEEEQLCSVLLGLEKSPSGCCFAYKLGKCRGACVGKETPELYNARFEAAFEKSSIKPWPFEKPVMIQEVDVETRVGENHVFDKWQYIGAIKYDPENTFFASNPNTSFDYDMYMILKRYLRSHTHMKQISRDELQKVQEGISI
jgi:DNA polymerase-3 subunit epsilon